MAQKPLLPVNRVLGRIVLSVEASSYFVIQPRNPTIFPLAVDVAVQVLQLLDIQRQADIVVRTALQIICASFAIVPAYGPWFERDHILFDAEKRGWAAT